MRFETAWKETGLAMHFKRPPPIGLHIFGRMQKPGEHTKPEYAFLLPPCVFFSGKQRRFADSIFIDVLSIAPPARGAEASRRPISAYGRNCPKSNTAFPTSDLQQVQ